MSEPNDTIITLQPAMPGEFYIGTDGTRHHVVAWRVAVNRPDFPAVPIFAATAAEIGMASRG